MVKSAEIIGLLGRLGIKGVTKVRCKVLEGDDKEKILTRNVVGPVSIGDIILLKDTQMDASGRFQRKG
jgi:small subunit ribosomal protein S28e